MFASTKKYFYSLVALVLLMGSAPLYAQVDLALNKPTNASTAVQAAVNAVDGNAGTRWESASADPSWISVDLGSQFALTSVVLDWEAANAATYQIQGSNDNAIWSILASKTGGVFGNRTDTTTVTGNYRYVRILGTSRTSQYGYSIYSLKVYGGAAASSSAAAASSTSAHIANVALGRPTAASTALQSAANAVDGDAASRWESAHAADPSWISVDLGAIYNLYAVTIRWEAANAANYQVQGSNDNASWVAIGSKTDGAFGVRTDSHTVSGNFRYVRIYCTARSAGNNWGYSIFELQVSSYGGVTSSVAATSSSKTSSSSSVAPISSKAAISSIASSISTTFNLASGRVATASTALQAATNAVDGNAGSRWESAHGVDPSWISVDLVGTYNLGSVVIDWEAANAGTYQIQGSNDNTNWIILATVNGGTFGNRTDTTAVTGRYRYVRIFATARSTGNGYGYSIFELKVFSSGETNSSSSLSSNSSKSATSSSVVATSSSKPSSSSVASSSKSSSPAISSAASSASSVALGNIVPLFNNTTALEQVIQFDRGDALVTRFSDRARDRHAKENHFQLHDHYLPFYWENRTAAIEIIDYVAKGGTTVRMNVTTLAKLDDLQAENRWWYVGNNTLAEFCGNGVMNVIDTTHYWKENNNNCRENFRAIKVGDKLEFEISQFLDKKVLPRGRDHYYGSTFLYIVGKGLVPWDVTDMNPFVQGKTYQRDSIELPVSAMLGGSHSLNRQTSAEPDDHFMQMAYGLGYDNGQPFVLGRRLAHTEFTNGVHDESEENGIFDEMVGKAGPNYVNSSCVQCHNRNGRAPVAAIGEPLTKWVFKVGDGTGNASPTLGRVLQPQNVNGAGSGEGNVTISSFTDLGNGLRKPNFQFERGAPAQFSARIAPQLVGIGLLEAIPESAILALADENDANGDGISGKAQKVTDPVTGDVRLGRFGYKAATASVRHQVAAALNTDMGVMTSVLPRPDCGSAQSNCGNTAGSELSDTHLTNLVKYIALLGVRSQRDYANAQVIQGKAIFTATGCAACHTETFKTSPYAPFAELRNETIHPYTDLLLHDMGAGLADNLGEGSATGAEWRTPPLWGVGLSPCVTGGVTGTPGGTPHGVDGNEVCTPSANYLHDGRARTLDEAIRWHGGEGLKAEQAYERLSAGDKDSLIKFINSL
jgi:CxxC motif-containing protein (DUF1111 family)